MVGGTAIRDIALVDAARAAGAYARMAASDATRVATTAMMWISSGETQVVISGQDLAKEANDMVREQAASGESSDWHNWIPFGSTFQDYHDYVSCLHQ